MPSRIGKASPTTILPLHTVHPMLQRTHPLTLTIIGSNQAMRTHPVVEAMQKRSLQPTGRPCYLRQIRIRVTRGKAPAMECTMVIQADTDELLRTVVLQQRPRHRVGNGEECRVDSSLHQLRPKVTMSITLLQSQAVLSWAQTWATKIS